MNNKYKKEEDVYEALVANNFNSDYVAWDMLENCKDRSELKKLTLLVHPDKITRLSDNKKLYYGKITRKIGGMLADFNKFKNQQNNQREREQAREKREGRQKKEAEERRQREKEAEKRRQEQYYEELENIVKASGNKHGIHGNSRVMNYQGLSLEFIEIIENIINTYLAICKNNTNYTINIDTYAFGETERTNDDYYNAPKTVYDRYISVPTVCKKNIILKPESINKARIYAHHVKPDIFGIRGIRESESYPFLFRHPKDIGWSTNINLEDDEMVIYLVYSYQVFFDKFSQVLQTLLSKDYIKHNKLTKYNLSNLIAKKQLPNYIANKFKKDNDPKLILIPSFKKKYFVYSRELSKNTIGIKNVNRNINYDVRRENLISTISKFQIQIAEYIAHGVDISRWGSRYRYNGLRMPQRLVTILNSCDNFFKVKFMVNFNINFSRKTTEELDKFIRSLKEITQTYGQRRNKVIGKTKSDFKVFLEVLDKTLEKGLEDVEDSFVSQ